MKYHVASNKDALYLLRIEDLKEFYYRVETGLTGETDLNYDSAEEWKMDSIYRRHMLFGIIDIQELTTNEIQRVLPEIGL